MLWLAHHEWVWLLVSALLGGILTAALLIRRYAVRVVTERVLPAEAAKDAQPAALVDADEVGEDGPYGVGSALALADGSAPHERFTIKGNANSGLYHSLESPYYGRTIAEIWFDTEDRAIAAGFKRWDVNL